MGETMPEMGRTPPRLGLKIGAQTDGVRMSVISPKFERNPRQPAGAQIGPIFSS